MQYMGIWKCRFLHQRPFRSVTKETTGYCSWHILLTTTDEENRDAIGIKRNRIKPIFNRLMKILWKYRISRLALPSCFGCASSDVCNLQWGDEDYLGKTIDAQTSIRRLESKPIEFCTHEFRRDLGSWRNVARPKWLLNVFVIVL